MGKANQVKKNINLYKFLLVVVTIAALTFPGVAPASDIGSPSPEDLKGLYPGKAY